MAARATVELAVDESGGVSGLTRFQRAGTESFDKVKAAAAGVTAETNKAAAATEALTTSRKKASENVSKDEAAYLASQAKMKAAAKEMADEWAKNIATVTEKNAAAKASVDAVAESAQAVPAGLAAGSEAAAAMSAEVKVTAVAADVLAASVTKVAETMKVAQAAAAATAQTVRVAAAPAPAATKQPKTITAPTVENDLANATRAADQLGDAGERAGRKIADGQDEAKGHTLSSLDSVRLMRDDLGVRVPRAMERLIASTEVFQKVAGVAFNAFALVGVLELVGAIGDKLSDWAHILTGDTKAVQELRKALVEANDARMAAPTNSTVAQQSREELQATLKTLEARKEMNSVSRIPDWLLGNAVGGGTKEEQSALKHWTPEMEDELIKTRRLLGDVSENNAKREESWNERNASQLRANTEIQLEGLRKIAQATANAHALVQDKTLGINGQEKSLTPAQAQTENTLIDQKAAAEYAVLSHKYADEVRDAWQASALARVQGEQRAYTQMSQAVQNFEEQARRDGRMDTPDGQAQVYGEETAMWSKYLAEKAERQKQFTDETLQMTQQARILESEGTQRALVEESVALERLAQERIDTGRQSLEFEQEFADRRVQIEADADAKITASIKAYADKQREAHAEAVVNDSKGYARIDAEQNRRTADSNKQFGDITSGLQWDDPRYVTAKTAHDGQLADIGKMSDDQRKDLHQRNLDETQGLRDEAASTRSSGGGLMGMLAEEQAQTSKINAEYDKRRQHLKEALAAGVVNEQEAADQASAIEDLHTAQLDAQYRSMREKIAGSIESGFKDPLGAIKSAMQRQMAEIIADWVMQLGVFKTIFGNTMSSRSGSGQSSGGILGSILQRGRSSAGASEVAESAGTYSPTIATSGTSVSSAGSSSTLSHAVAAPIGGVAGSSMSPSSTISGALGLSRTGADAVQALQPSATTSAIDDDAAWNDPSKMSSSDPSSAGYHVNAIQGTGTAGITALGVAGAGMGAYTGTTGIISAFESGKAGGILSGGLSGASMGASIGMLAGPMGATIGAGVGAVGGSTAGLVGWASGEGGRIQGEKYFKDTLKPQMEAAEKSYTSGEGGDAAAAISSINAEAVQGYGYLFRTIGGSAAAWTRDAYINKERDSLTSSINRMARGGRDYTAMTAAEFHDGGPITDFGDWSTSSNEGMIHALLDETVMNRSASTAHGPALGLMNSGASQAQMAGYYLSQMQPQTNGTQPPAVSHKHEWTVHAIDAKSFEDFMRTDGAAVTHKALNQYVNDNASDGF